MRDLVAKGVNPHHDNPVFAAQFASLSSAALALATVSSTMPIS
jgi:hypothetical protein